MSRMITDLKEIRNMRIRDHEKRRSGYKKRQNVFADTEVRNLLGGSNNTLNTTVESTSELEKRSGKITQMASERPRLLKYERVIQRQKKNERRLNIHSVGIPEGENRVFFGAT